MGGEVTATYSLSNQCTLNLAMGFALKTINTIQSSSK